jgi:hypothetical protein
MANQKYQLPKYLQKLLGASSNNFMQKHVVKELNQKGLPGYEIQEQNQKDTPSPINNKMKFKMANKLTSQHTGNNFWHGMRAVNKVAGAKDTWVEGLLDQLKGISGGDNRYYDTNPVVHTLAGTSLGALAGRGAGSLTAWLLGKKHDDPRDDWDGKDIKRTATWLGAALGATPGILSGVLNLSEGKPLNDTSAFQYNAATKKKAALAKVTKKSFYNDFNTNINGNQLINNLYNNPTMSSQFNHNQQNNFVDMINQSQNISGSSNFTPADLAKVAIGMGSGASMGYLGGKVLGALTGMPQSWQDNLLNAGLYGGTAKAVMNTIFR